ncbi:hypothetical protein [Sporolactobacillus sp. KGMB 08714]|uniref:hypothetical protein n=1 Tax=Sporolactobacillus sp. KGMB 08714 TaxID=3064704 RepID=UPI002FBE713B
MKKVNWPNAAKNCIVFHKGKMKININQAIQYINNKISKPDVFAINIVNEVLVKNRISCRKSRKASIFYYFLCSRLIGTCNREGTIEFFLFSKRFFIYNLGEGSNMESAFKKLISQLVGK